jgi:hypothetical protein
VTPPYFTDAERVAPELVEAVLTPNPFGERVPVALIAKPIRGKEQHYRK